MADIIGLQYPLIKTHRGIMAQKKGVDQVKADLLQLLLTNPGERVMMPEYGTPLRKKIFEPNDFMLETEVRELVATAIRRWEPRIVVTDITVTSDFSQDDLHPDDTGDERESILGIKIKFVDPNNLSNIESLDLQIPNGA